jgi:hypothetical protein
MKCLAKTAAERYQRGNDVADALIAYLSGQGSAAERRPAWLARRSGAAPIQR